MLMFKDMPIRKKLMRIMFLISGIVLLVTCLTFFVYEIYAFRKTTTEKLSTIGRIISANSTAALAFANAEDAKEILTALRAEPHIVAASLYNTDGSILSQYVSGSEINIFPNTPGAEGYKFAGSHLEGFQPVMLEDKQVGTLYLKSSLGEMYQRLRLYGAIVALVMLFSFILAFALSRIYQKNISEPILALADTATIISDKKDYSVRAQKKGNDELGLLTDAFNYMLVQIQDQNRALQEFAQNLEQKVWDRTVQLESANKELEAFSYSISHDLRAPLRAIVGFTAILEEDYGSKLDDEAKRVTGVIKSNTLKMGHLIDDLLTFSRLARQDLKKTRINTTEMANGVINEILSNNKNLNAKWIVHPMPDIHGDVTAMRHVWTNLISNAVKYSATKDQAIIEVGSDLKDGQTVFFVRDNGVGFDEKYKEKLFRVFQRLHSADEFEGTGVGLAIVEKIISKHGGNVWAEGEINKGACFYFSLPE